MGLRTHFFIPGTTIYIYAEGRVRLKKLQLLYRFRCFCQVMPPEYFHHAKLFVGNAHDAYMPFGWQYCFYSFYMYIRIFTAGTMAQVNAELKHSKAIGHNVFAETGIYLPVLFGFCWQIKKY